MCTSSTKNPESPPLREYQTHAEQWARTMGIDAPVSHQKPLASSVNGSKPHDAAQPNGRIIPAADPNHSRLKWAPPTLSITPAQAPWQFPTTFMPPTWKRDAATLGIYWVLAAAVGALLIGLATRGGQSRQSSVPAIRVARANAPAIAAAPTPPIATDDSEQPLFMLMLDPLRHQTVASHDLELKLRTEMTAAGFPNIGVSVTHYGEVFLAGRVSDPDEKDEILGLVRATPGVHEIHLDDIEIRRPSGPAYFGADTAPAADDIGVKVTEVYKGSPAEVAGILPGDIITRFGIQYVIDDQSFHYMVISHEGGQRIAVTILHDGAPRTVMVRLGGTSFEPVTDLASSVSNQDSMLARSSPR